MFRIVERIKSLFSFSRSEIRGVLWLLPLIAVIGVIIVFANRPRFEKSFLEQVEEENLRRDFTAEKSDITRESELFIFDPNTVSLQELCRLGLSQRTAAGIIKYRERGKRFEIPEDFAACYGVSLEKYTELEPYINIGDGFRVQHANNGVRITSQATEQQSIAENIGLSDFDPNSLDAGGFVALGFSPAQASSIVKYRTSIGGSFRTIEEFGKSYVVAPQMFEKLRPYIKITSGENIIQIRLVDLNGADSTELRSVSGIGEVLVKRIMDYRTRLGGYARIEQLAEIPGMTEENFNRIRKQIFVDSCKIQKIDINFAPHQSVVEVLGNHPYITAQGVRKLLKNRQLKGGWRSIGDMVDENIVTKQQAERLAPYLIFKSE